MARALAQEDCRVVLVDQNLPDTTALVNPQKHLSVQCNVADSEQVFDMMAQAVALDAPASLLVNCAGITRDGWVSKMSVQDWDSVMDVNLKGTFLTCRAFLDHQRHKRLQSNNPPQSSSSIVNIGSIVAQLGNLGQANYAASKGGVEGLTRALAKEAASRDVRVNAILPGFIDTPMARAVPEPIQQEIVTKIPLRRFGTPEEIANVVCFLLSPRSSYMTGAIIPVSGMIAL